MLAPACTARDQQRYLNVAFRALFATLQGQTSLVGQTSIRAPHVMRNAAAPRSLAFSAFSPYSAASDGAHTPPALHKRAQSAPCATAPVFLFFFSPISGPIRRPPTVYTFASKIGSSHVPATETKRKQREREFGGNIFSGVRCSQPLPSRHTLCFPAPLRTHSWRCLRM